MPISFRNSLDQLTQRMVDLLWHQWSSMGVAGYARPDENRIIDPEALILATTRFGRYDSRLMDESIDWLVKFGNRISLQRLQGLNKNWPGVAAPPRACRYRGSARPPDRAPQVACPRG